jgi:hypothetical protein
MSFSNTASFVERDVLATRIAEATESQDFVRRTQGHPSEIAPEWIATSNASHSQPGTESSTPQQGQIQTQQQPQSQTRQMPQQMGQGRYESKNTFNHSAPIQYRVQEILAGSYQGLPIPRFFILLPEPTEVVGGQRPSGSLQLRIHFLCECSHAMIGKGSDAHEIHLANHPGYRLDKQEEFMREYGPPVLGMMYMVKYGVKGEGLVVPPLLGLKSATEDGDDEGDLGFIKKNIDRLIDDTITHLEEAFIIAGIDVNTFLHQKPDFSKLAQMKRYLSLEEDEEGLIGDLSQTTTQDGRCVWICSEHKREYHDSTLQCLTGIITSNGGKCSRQEYEVHIKIISSELKTRLYSAIAELCRIQGARDQHSRIALDFKLSCNDPTTNVRSSANLLVNLDSFESLRLDFDRLSIEATTDHRGSDDVVVSIEQLSDLGQEDFEFILPCRPTRMEILHTPEIAEEARLVTILQWNPTVVELSITCRTERSIAVIETVMSTVETSLQGITPMELRTLEMTSERLIPCKDGGVITVKIQLPGRSSELDMETHLILDKYGSLTASFGSGDGLYVCDLIRRCGWSIRNLTISDIFDDRHAMLLDEATKTWGSSIAYLAFFSTILTPSGLDALERVVHRSKHLTSVRLDLSQLHSETRLRKAIDLVRRFQGRLKGLRLSGELVWAWLGHLARAFPVRSDFPMLEELHIECPTRLTCGADNLRVLPCTSLQWITCMVSAPLPPLTRLKRFGIFNVPLQQRDMSSLIEAIDLSAMVELRLVGTGITQEQLERLVDRITDDNMPALPLTCLDLGTNPCSQASTRALWEKLRIKFPLIRNLGTE